VSIILIISFSIYIVTINAKRVRSEEEAKWSRHIIETKNRLETLFDGITDGICIIGKDYNLITMNKAMKELMSVENDNYEGEHCYKLFCKSDSICDVCPVRETFETGKSFQIQREIKGENGDKTYWQISTFPIKDANGNVNQVIKYVRDFTENKRISDELELSKRLSALGQMIAGVAHEIKNPLQNISMGISLIKYDIDKDSESAKTLEGVIEGVKKLNNIVSDLLDFSRPLKIETIDYDINEVLEGVIDEFSAEFSAKRVILHKNFLNKGNSNVKIDAFKIKQVFYNLFQNALEAMPDGGQIWVVSDSQIGNGIKRVIIKIKDSGVGIREDNINQVFDPFFTTKSKGVGLGMAIVKRIIELHGGTISVESEEGKGTEFTIVFEEEIGVK
ncbi:MAG: PAS domain-containing protein, partial [Candidatus Schekmanbacteria bacterium]